MVVLVLAAGLLLAALPVHAEEPEGAAQGDATRAAAARPSRAAADAELEGFLERWSVAVLGLEAGQVEATVADGVLEISGTVATAEEKEQILAMARLLDERLEVADRIEVGPAPPPPPKESKKRWTSWLGWARPAEGRKTVPFPRGDLFSPPLADQKQPRFHATWQKWGTDFGTFDVASVGFGENFGLVRRPARREGDGWQIGLSGAVFAIFNLDSQSNDLLNADYVIGVPWSFRNGRWSGRARLYHQSSHLGDEFLLNPQPGPPVERLNLSYEALELLGSWERGGYRLYGGPSRILSSETRLGRDRVQAGFEHRGHALRWRSARLVQGLDVEWWEETDWEADVSLKAGLMFRSPYSEARSLQVLLEYYDGHAPHGQFYPLDVEYWGIGLAFSM